MRVRAWKYMLAARQPELLEPTNANCSVRKSRSRPLVGSPSGQGHHWSAWADESGPQRPPVISVKRRTVRAKVTSVADGAGEVVPGLLQIWATNRRRPRRQLAPCRLHVQTHMYQGRQRRAPQGRALESPRLRRRTPSSSVCRRTCQRHRHSLTRSRCLSLGR